MERYVITMGDFLKNAGIVGMEYLLETAGARRDVDYGITEDADRKSTRLNSSHAR